MPHPTKVQPVDFNEPPPELQTKCYTVANPVLKTRFKRLFERPFSSSLKTLPPPPPPPPPPLPVKLTGYKEPMHELEEFDPSSFSLSKMVQNFMEENIDKHLKCGRNPCDCGNCKESSDDEPDSYKSSMNHAIDVLKSLMHRVNISEKNLLADTAKIAEKYKIGKRKDGFCRKIVADGLIALGYNASICKSKWEKTSVPAGEHEYVDVIIGSERLIIEIDFRSEFEIARSTKAYKQVLQTLPNIFIGKSEHLEKIICIVSEAGRQSLKKKGMPFPPWRKADYVKAKWLSPFTRMITGSCDELSSGIDDDNCDNVCPITNSVNKKWEIRGVKPKMVTGLASVIEDEP